MTAFQKLIMFSDKLDGELCTEYQQLISDYMDERDRLQNERLANSIKYDVIAIAGTSEQLLTDVINVGDTVELNPNAEQTEGDLKYLRRDSKYIYSLNKVTSKTSELGEPSIVLNNGTCWHPLRLFRKVSTPSTNPHKTIEGC